MKPHFTNTSNPVDFPKSEINERILELARQVWPDPNISHVNHMKFAELIVKECIDIAYREGDNVAYLALYFGVE